MRSPKARCLAALLLLLLSCQLDAFAQGIVVWDYPYSYKDPWVATSTVALMEGNETIPSVTIKDLQISIINRLLKFATIPSDSTPFFEALRASEA